MKKILLGITIVAIVLGVRVEAKAAVSIDGYTERTFPVANHEKIDRDTDANNYLISEKVTYHYEQLQESLDVLNKAREEAVEYGFLKEYKPFKLDKELTEKAMMEAADTAVFYSHNSPSVGGIHGNVCLSGGGSGPFLVGQWCAERDNLIENNGGETGHYMWVLSVAEYVGLGIVETEDHQWIGSMVLGSSTTGEDIPSEAITETYSCNISNNLLFGLATQYEVTHTMNYLSDEVHDNFTAYTKSPKQFQTRIFRDYYVTPGWEFRCGAKSDMENGNGHTFPISASNVNFDSLNTDILTIDENGVMQGKKAGTATVRVTLKQQEGVTFKDFTTSSVDYTITVLDGGLYEQKSTATPLAEESWVSSFLPADKILVYDGYFSKEDQSYVEKANVPGALRALDKHYVTENDIIRGIEYYYVWRQKTVEELNAERSKLETTMPNTNNTQNETKKTTNNETKKTETAKKTTTKMSTVKVPTKVDSVKATKKNKKVTVKFNKASNAKKYEIQITTSKKFKYVKSVKVTGLKKTIKVKASWAKKTMYVRVRAINGTVKGYWSSVKKIKK